MKANFSLSEFIKTLLNEYDGKKSLVYDPEMLKTFIIQNYPYIHPRVLEKMERDGSLEDALNVNGYTVRKVKYCRNGYQHYVYTLFASNLADITEVEKAIKVLVDTLLKPDKPYNIYTNVIDRIIEDTAYTPTINRNVVDYTFMREFVLPEIYRKDYVKFFKHALTNNINDAFEQLGYNKWIMLPPNVDSSNTQRVYFRSESDDNFNRQISDYIKAADHSYKRFGYPKTNEQWKPTDNKPTKSSGGIALLKQGTHWSIDLKIDESFHTPDVLREASILADYMALRLSKILTRAKI